MRQIQSVSDAERGSAPVGGKPAPAASASDILRSLLTASKACRDQIGLALSDRNLYSGQDALLRTLATGDTRCATEIAAELRVRPPTVTKMVDRLSAGGFVSRSSRPDDRRRVRIELTDKGHEALDHVTEVWGRLDAIVASALSPDEMAQLSAALKKVEASLTRSVDRLR